MKTLKLVSREFEGFDRSFAHQAAAFHEASVQRDFLEITELYRRMITERQAATPAHDLFLCVTDWLPEAIRGGLLTPLNEFLEDDPPEGWPDAWSPSMRGLQTDAQGNVYGIAYHDGPEMFMYRKDLFEDPAEKQHFQERFGYELAPPTTWSQFLDVARFFTRTEQGLWGACFAGYPDAHNNVYDFMIHLWTRGGQLLDAGGRPRFNSAVGREALTYYRDLLHAHKVVSPQCLEMDSVASGFYYAEGNAAMMWNWSGFAAVAEQPSMSKIVGKNGVAMMPRGDGPDGVSKSLNIYWVLGIPAGSENKREAYRFLKHVASPQMDKATSMLGGNGTRLSTWSDPEVQATFPFYKIIEEVHQSVESPPPIPEYPEIAEVLNHMVDDVLRGRKEVEDALNQAEAAVESLVGVSRASSEGIK